MQLPENKNPPQQAPELIGVGKRDAAADADVFGGVLLEDVADDPDETAEHQPENDGAGALQFVPQRSEAEGADGEERHHTQFAEGKESHEGKRIHAGQVGFAVRDVHGAPKNSGAQGSPDAVERMRGGAAS